ncbi:30S ribosomal protein S6e [Candidatus Woesearchaeota archaeon]|nr:30S ribosomal protein S6e [Candidatus Woesearchaeota archaeon]MCF7901320.1 30S ribosomal protein S6e [Candidatus Woesearchaeota archaeon]MCF8013994.1 30S ribosomal protein S6e [Candidatus Woesearchaeota archaeon]
MVEFKLNLGDPKTKKTKKHEIKDDETEVFLDKKIGDKVKGDSFGFDGFEFEITGGSDYTGVPMRRDVLGTARQKILIVSGTGIRKNRKGRRVRKTMAGNTIYERTAQINLKVVKEGKTPLFEEAKPEAEATAEEETAAKEVKSEEAPNEEKKEE